MFNLNLYISEMNNLVDNSIDELLRKNANFQFYTIYIWTEPDACESGIYIDDFLNCQKEVERLNKVTKKRHIKLVDTIGHNGARPLKLRNRNYNGNYFFYANFIDNLSFPKDWEYLSPAIKTIGLYTFEKVKQYNHHANLEVIANGKNDWHEFAWTLET